MLDRSSFPPHQGIKRKNSTEMKMDATQMLAELFQEENRKDPFDDKKVMFKLKELLGDEDFKQVC